MQRETHEIERRAFLRAGGLVLLSGASAMYLPATGLASVVKRRRRTARVGLLTDVHHAEKKAAGTRYYRESLGKVREAVKRFNEERAELAIELGDFVDAAPTLEREIGFLETINTAYARFSGERHYVLGNHCVTTLTKAEFLKHTGAKKSHYSFDRGGFHLIVLDACYRKDGVPYGRNNFVWTDTDIPNEQREWLAEDLERAKLPAIVFVHQRLDVTEKHSVQSAARVRAILEKSRKVVAVFQGHSHENDYQHTGGIHYTTLAALVEGAGLENNAYGILDLYEDGMLVLRGFRRQASREWEPDPGDGPGGEG